MTKLPVVRIFGRSAWCDCAAVAAVLVLNCAPVDASPISPTSAIALQSSLCQADHGRLWGISLCSPFMVVDPSTLEVIANTNSPQHLLTDRDGNFVGHLPRNTGVANTALDWDGVKWAMVITPLPTETRRLGELVMHESFHSIQDRLGLPMRSSSPAHLDTLEGRIAMRMEWRALAAALQSEGEARRAAIRDALVFRASRRALSSTARTEENALELNEGLAEYTGRVLGDAGSPDAGVVETLALYDKKTAYSRSFAYASGPAYGVLLDSLAPGWRQALTADSDLGELLARAIGAGGEAGHGIRIERYDAAVVEAQERALSEARDAQKAKWRSALLSPLGVQLPLIHPRIEFNPSNLLPLPPDGTVYPTATLQDDWGVLTVMGGALVNDTWSVVHLGRLLARDDDHIQGDGWSLKLSAEWALSVTVSRIAAAPSPLRKP